MRWRESIYCATEEKFCHPFPPPPQEWLMHRSPSFCLFAVPNNWKGKPVSVNARGGARVNEVGILHVYLYCLPYLPESAISCTDPQTGNRGCSVAGKFKSCKKPAMPWERGICKYVNDGAALTTSFIMQGICGRGRGGGGGNLVSGESACNPEGEYPLEE